METQDYSNELLKNVKSIKKNVQFITWLIIISIAIVVIDAILGMYGYYIFSNW